MTATDDLAEVPTVSEFDDKGIFLQPARGELAKILVLGSAIGLLLPFLSYAINKYFVVPVFCSQSAAQDFCVGSELNIYYILSVIFGIAAIALLAQWQVFRPLLIAVGSTAALWGFSRFMQELSGNSGIEYYATSAILYSAAYMLFYWIMRVRSFAISIGLTIALVVAVRFVLIS